MTTSVSKQKVFNIVEWVRIQFKNRGFFANFAKLFAGNVSAQVIGLLAAPVITRMYDPKDFGIMALVTSVITVFSVISCLRYERAIMLPKYDNDAENILWLCIILAGIVTIAVVLIMASAKDLIAGLLGEPGLSNWLWFVPLGVILFGIRQPFTFWHSRKRDFGIVSWSQIHLSFWTVATKITAGYAYGSSAVWLIIGNLNGALCAAFWLAASYYRKKREHLIKVLSRETIICEAKKYKKFPIYSSWTALFSAFSQNIVIFLLSYFYTPAIVGLYALGNNILRRPIGLISESITKVILEKTARTYASGESLDKTFKKITIGLFLIAIIPSFIIVWLGPQLFSLFFGERWYTAGHYARILIPWLFFVFISTPANHVITVHQKLKFNLIFHVMLMIARFLVFIIGSLLYDDPAFSLMLFSVVSAGFFAYYIFYSFRLVTAE